MWWLCLAVAFYGQNFQDKYLEETFFQGKAEGVFVDIGAHDGVTFNNTYFFEKEKGWKGICIEPIPAVFSKLKDKRTAVCVQGCVANRPGKAAFTHVKGYAEMLSGLSAKHDVFHKARIEKETKEWPAGNSEILQVECFLLNDLLEKNGFFHVDYLSLDTEGGELEILQSIDYEKFDIDVIDVENSRQDPAFKKFLLSKGYVLITRLGLDEIYKKKRYELIPSTARPNLDFIGQFLPENPVIVEAGAHVGVDTVQMHKKWKNGYIYAFEPSPEVYAKLVNMCKNMKNVKTIPVALGDKDGFADFYVSGSAEGGDGGLYDGQGSLFPVSQENWKWKEIGLNKSVQVPVATLDSWAKKNHLSKIDFLWLDMQGSEFQMLKASPEILKTVQVIQTEVSRKPFYEGTIVLDEGKAWLESQGFTAIYVTPDEHGDALFVRTPK